MKLLASIMALIFPAAEALAGEGRLAVVVGNAHYASEHYGELPSPLHDACGISAALRQLGFDSITRVDLTERNWDDLLSEAKRVSEGYRAVVFYYSGHAVQVSGHNLLIPIDAGPPASAQDLAEHTIDLGKVIHAMSIPGHQTLVLLDADRDNPFAGATIGGAPAPYGVFVAFAAAPGRVTVPAKDNSSAFATALVKNLTRENSEPISATMVRVQGETFALTAGEQTPWMQSSLVGEFRFNEPGSDRIGEELNRESPCLSE